MRKLLIIILILLLLPLIGCAAPQDAPMVAATTLPVFDLTQRLCSGTDISVGRLVTESVSCLHDYSLQVGQMRTIESAELIVISGAGLEDFLGTALDGKSVIDASSDVHIHNEEDHPDHRHSHDSDPHIWLSPENAKQMARNICAGLCREYPEYEKVFLNNLDSLTEDLDILLEYGKTQLGDLGCRQIITFHDGFGYFAESFDITILESVEEESGSEASAAEIIHLANTIRQYHLSAVFVERSGSDSCARILSAETGAEIYTLDMAMAGDSYFEAMYHNIDTLKEALS